ncbi:MAG: universal stress protein [Pirellulales bacterium]|nr:universal stress protein [Pirellulales bacterium]
MVATDLSDFSESTIRTAASLGLFERMNISLLHVFDIPGIALFSRASLPDVEKQSYIAGERKRAMEQVASFIARVSVEGMSPVLKPATVNIAEAICKTASELSAELIVIGTCGRSMVARALIGSVTEGVLRNSDRDVLAIPPPQNRAVS